MAEVSYAPEPTYSSGDYEKAKALLASGGVPPDKQNVVKGRLAEFEKSEAMRTQALGETQTSQLDPAKEHLINKVKAATRDDTLKNASSLKVFNDPTEYEPPPKPPSTNPFSALGGGMGSPGMSADQNEAITSHAWHEPTLQEFRGALKNTPALAGRVRKEFDKAAYGTDLPEEAPAPGEHATPKVKGLADIGNKPLDPWDREQADLENSDAFKVYRDAAWQHALADAIKARKPIYRLQFSDKLSPADKVLAQASDTGKAAVSGGLQAGSFGLSDPLMRSVNPSATEDLRKARLRNPGADLGGQLVGGALGAPEALAGATAKGLGGVLGKSTLGRLATSVGTGATVGATDVQTRSIAQAAADALDAGDSAAEVAKKMYEALNPQTMLQGGLEGGLMGGVGHLAGGAAHALGKAIATSGNDDALPRATIVENNLGTGGKMDWKGQIKTEPEIDNLSHASALENMSPDQVLANKVREPMLQQRRIEQEEAARRHDETVQRARDLLDERATPVVKNGSMTSEMPHAAVPVEDTADRLRQYAGTLVDDTERRDVLSAASKLQKASILSPEQLDKYIDWAEKKAGYAGNKKLDIPKSQWLHVAKELMVERDNLLMEGTTPNGGVAHRNAHGETSMVPGNSYSRHKTEISGELAAQHSNNEQMGLPGKLEVKPRIVSAPDETSATALAESMGPNVQLKDQAAVDKFDQANKDVGALNRGPKAKLTMGLAERSGVGDEMALMQKLRNRDDYRKMLGGAVSGMAVGPSGVGRKYISSNQLLRAVPTLKSLGGGLPRMEASQQLVDLVDKAMDQAAGGHGARWVAGENIMGKMVPEAKALNLQGGKPARHLGALTRNEQDSGDKNATLSPEEAAFANQIIKRLLEQQRQETAQ